MAGISSISQDIDEIRFTSDERRGLAPARRFRRLAFLSSVLRTVSTGQVAVRTTFSATLPMNRCARPVRPCVAMTIRSAPARLAVSMMICAGEPVFSMVRTSMPLFSRSPAMRASCCVATRCCSSMMLRQIRARRCTCPPGWRSRSARRRARPTTRRRRAWQGRAHRRGR